MTMDYIKDLYDLEQTLAKDWLAGFRYPWEALSRLGDFIVRLGESLPKEEYRETAPRVWVHATAEISPSAELKAPCVIGRFAEVRTGALIAGNVLVGEGCVVGAACQLENSILFSGVQLQHSNFVTDSILGTRCFLRSGASVSTVLGERQVSIHDPAGDIETGLRKVGAFLGDFAVVGCNSVLRPGAVVGRNGRVKHLMAASGVIPGREKPAPAAEKPAEPEKPAPEEKPAEPGKEETPAEAAEKKGVSLSK